MFEKKRRQVIPPLWSWVMIKNVCKEASLFFLFSGNNEQLVKKVLKEVHISSKPCLYNFWLKSKTASWFWIQQLRLNKFSFCDIKVGNTNDMNDFAFSLQILLSIYSTTSNLYVVFLLAHLSWKLKWAFLIAFRSSSVNFPYFGLLLKNRWANFNQPWHKAYLGEGDSSLFKWRAPPFLQGEIIMK